MLIGKNRSLLKFSLCFIFTFILFNLFGIESQTFCLNMIVKDEKDVIERCLASVKPLINYWVIVDTGSSDNTQKIIQDFMKDIPGELHERPWKNFAHNRNEALELAKDKADYIVFIDADEVFEYERGYKFPKLDKNCYFINTDLVGLIYKRPLIVKNNSGFKWKGVVHETLYGPEPIAKEPLIGIMNIPKPDGARSKDPNKFLKDAALFEEELKKNPRSTRDIFYLAQSYRDAGDHPKAIENYKKRASMEGWDQEVFWSLLQVGVLEELTGVPSSQIVDNYFNAFQKCPSRAEPLYYLARYYRKNKNYAASYTISKLGMLLPIPQDALFVEKWVYDYLLPLENSVAAYWLGKFTECKTLSENILAMKILPDNVRTQVEKNLAFANDKLKESMPRIQNKGLNFIHKPQ